MIYFFVTTSINNDSITRKIQYIYAINKLKEVISLMELTNYKIIIIENNGQRETYLDTLGCEVFYTNNNKLQTNNKGYKELQDIFDTIQKYQIQETDFIVKITGRYILENDSEFMNIVKNLHIKHYDCIIRYGSFLEQAVKYKTDDCISGLIGMTCEFIKQIKLPRENCAAEWDWAEVTYLIKDKNIYMVNKLGINIFPVYKDINDYFLV